MDTELRAQLVAAIASNELLQTSFDNIHELLDASDNPVYETAVSELANDGQWRELNNRFFKKLAFGTGGLRGRSIGEIITRVEQGSAAAYERPEHPCVGTATLNFYNITKATLGLVKQLKKSYTGEGKPSIALARDTRFFGKAFAECAAKVANENGVDIFLFPQPRSTPELSFAVRHLGTTAGIVLTASHNPPHDNGFKAYGRDGAQLVDPDASEVIAEVNSIKGENYEPLLAEQQGRTTELGAEMDEIYMERLKSLLLNPELVKSKSGLKIVFTNIHGTGGTIAPHILRRLGFRCDTVHEQDSEDGAFPTVKSPNPENAEALQMGIDQAEASNADVVIGTDPDSDRMGVAVRNGAGDMTLLTGNQIGSLIAYYRLEMFTSQGILNEGNCDKATLVKTFVTTELQQAIADSFGVSVVNTLTGFKYIGGKLRKYENQIPTKLRAQYRNLSDEKTRALRLEHSKFFVFGGEESYGYLGGDFLRDKDGNGAAVMFAEVAAYANSLSITAVELLDQLYAKHGVYLEGQHAETLTGADGADKIQRLAQTYIDRPPTEIDGTSVERVRDFANQDNVDEEGDPVPKEKMVFVDLADGRAFAVRPSGTEPKIKYYVYYRPKSAPAAVLSDEQLVAAKISAEASFGSLKEAIVTDMRSRLG
ncbi:MAG: phosphomannomutase [Verrucomicrobiales bacterium]|nr:phosphomannomutase [Verrucomicrobiales bacterium]|tara:strand:- start:9096 stop:11051 length:1956 start_codon:yes stop_codon:yes gene_type:complete